MAHDKQWFVDTLEDVCRQNFYVVDEVEVFGNTEVQKKDSKTNTTENEKEEEQAEREVADEIDPKRKDQFLWPIKDPEQLYYSRWN